MARIKIKDLPKDMRISKEEIKKVRGGGGVRKSSFITLGRSASFNYGGIVWTGRGLIRKS
ncbi:MAG: hypothetical protein NTV82_13765 [Candidatus Aminicenantes bacterium]|jgi:hypothetical protein|nr:hypothetical protein [Candidatus Aminicenantes bacterium]